MTAWVPTVLFCGPSAVLIGGSGAAGLVVEVLVVEVLAPGTPDGWVGDVSLVTSGVPQRP